jgi:hypothetical protein
MKKDRRGAKLEDDARKKQKQKQKRERERERLASKLAPQEELSAPQALADTALLDQERGLDAADGDYVDGSVILDGDQIDLPRQILQVEGGRRGTWMNPVLLVVMAIALSFTAFIAYLISIGPG